MRAKIEKGALSLSVGDWHIISKVYNVESVRIGQQRVSCVKDTWILYHSMADRVVSRSQVTDAADTKINQKKKSETPNDDCNL